MFLKSFKSKIIFLTGAADMNVETKHADKALRQAKKEGRNKVVFYDDKRKAQY